MSNKQYSKEEKLAIIKESSEQGVRKTLSKYGIYAPTYYDWKKKLDEMGEEGLNFRVTPPQLKRIRELEKENKMLKELLAESHLENKARKELVEKKRYQKRDL
jgi:putative transposase